MADNASVPGIQIVILGLYYIYFIRDPFSASIFSFPPPIVRDLSLSRLSSVRSYSSLNHEGNP
jgi:hypothetical protein